MRLKALAAVVAALALPAAAQAATVPVTSLSGDFAASNPSVSLVADGAAFGPYANGGAAGGSVLYTGANGLTLADITSLAYTVTHNSTDDSLISAPYLRVFLGNDLHDVIFDPTRCATVVPDENTANHYDVTSGDVRYDDDSCDGVAPDQQPWGAVVGTHGDEIISGIYVSAGFAGGQDLSALLADLTVNGDTFVFGAPQAGPAGDPGAAGGSGQAGAPGAAGTTTTVFVTVPGAVSSPLLRGDDLRVIHAPRHGHERFVKVRATLRGKPLRVRRNSVTVDLRGQPAGNYNVHLSTTFRKADGSTHVVRTTRNLSVTPV